ncbi:MAG: 4-hydroxybenzoate octaprenyltransferase [Planctomycetota bacterium]|nr:MAG: 4-hydroxybenzoate octaprenyltransferase [Planctomycetota bacterium]
MTASPAPERSTPPWRATAALRGAVDFLHLIRFSHTIFALPFALLACVMALRVPRLDGTPVPMDAGTVAWRTVGVVLCMVFARSAAMAFNRWVDADIDARNERTAGRHLPAGLLSKRQVIGFFLACSAAFGASTLLFLPNWLPAALAPAVLAWLCGYSLAKRFTVTAHLWLGVALALAPVASWIAMRGEIVLDTPRDLLPTFVLAAAIALWVAGFDIIYACQDADFDRREGLYSVPGRWGVPRALRIARWLHLAMLGVLAVWPFCFPHLGLGWIYAVGWVVVAVLVVRQHRLVRPDDLGRVGFAFFHLNALISLGFCSMAAIDCWF